MIEATRALTDRPFNINVFCHRTPAPDPAGDAAWLHHLAPLYARLDMAPPTRLVEVYPSFMDDDRMLDVLLETRPAVVSFHFGLPAPHQLQALKKAGICLLASATNLDEARRIEAAGLDAIIAQGIEAGGHRGCFDPEPGVPLPPDERLSAAVLVRQLVLNTPAAHHRCRRHHGRPRHSRHAGTGRRCRAAGHRLRGLSGIRRQRSLPGDASRAPTQPIPG